MAKIWIEENGQKKIEVAWSELSVDEEALIRQRDDNYGSNSGGGLPSSSGEG